MNRTHITHPTMRRPTRRELLTTGAAAAGIAAFSPLRAFAFQTKSPQVKIFDVLKFGATGDGTTLDSAAFQRAIDEASSYPGKAQVLVRGGHKYLIGTIELKGSIDFHLADDAQLLISTKREDYRGGLPGSQDGDTMAAALGAVIMATNAQGLRISGTGNIQGRAKEFMKSYDQPNEWWLPGDFRPKMFVLTGCKDLEVRDITFAEAPNWGLHMLGCDRVLVDNVKVRNLLDVPNCDGIDPDHSRNVEIRNCDLVCGDDGVVIKCSRQPADYGECSNIHVHDCVIDTQDAGLKIGTETTSDVHNIRFERCQIKNSSRGLCIQLRDEGNIYNIDYRDITFNSHYFSNPWWGRGEAISFTAIPRTPASKPGTLHHINVSNVTGRAENSVRVCGSAQSRIHDVSFDRVSVTLDRTTKYPGGLFDNRPTTAQPGIEPRDTPGFSIEHADNVTLRNCKVAWGANRPDYFSYALEAKDTTSLKVERFAGKPAHVNQGRKAVSVS
ncbi:MAG: glycosyl hydrolase family 28 protein [Acidobacteriota bacterium]|nr:glycosyl hydrolase family 28 protein [Acidobacteriota bacterium]